MKPGTPRRRVRHSSIALAIALGLGVATVSGSADGAVFERGRIDKIVDGDTVTVTTTDRRVVKIRLSGVDTMEVGRCHSSAATAFTRQIIGRNPIRLMGSNPSTVSRGRLVRYIEVLVDGRWVDVQRALLRNGHALPLFFPGETTRWRSYMKAAQQARSEGIGIWDDDHCRVGPSAGADLTLWINYDGDGDEGLDVNTEWVRILNSGTEAVDLSRWWVRSGNHDWYVFPSDSIVLPGEYTTIYLGTGTRSGSDHFWGYTRPKFPNLISPAPMGGGAYLFDPDGDIRASAMYPCLTGCTESRSSALRLDVNYDSPGFDAQSDPNGEYVVIGNRSSAPVDISFTTLQYNGATLELPAATVVPPDGQITVFVGSGRPYDGVLFWGQRKAILKNTGGAVFLRTTDSVMITCSAWGNGRCPPA